MTAKIKPKTATHVRLTSIKGFKTKSFAKKPTVGGTPAIENRMIIIMNANHGLRLFSPLKSCTNSTSKPERDISTNKPKAPTDINA